MAVKVEDITPARGFTLVDKAELERLRKREHTGVPSRYFLSSDEMLIGDGFTRCQAVALLNGTLGALLHNHPQEDPSGHIYGDFKEKGKAINPREVFTEMPKVKAVHVYHESNNSYPNNWIEYPLKKLGIKSVLHVPILDRNPGHPQWMDIVLDVKQRALYVFPTDFDKGIKLDIK